ncbi:disks large homolog 1-like isoform X2 [Puntigrus tetrazona]|uniref:disks large homolog 1-like isoform X2 n=1 Tax=Puntigrus tetrazona TaxID=1606681 RepID=UPI001C899446|nr:disks large homolog 1-like isoform X2 [Puntigrus tetrazona]
MPLRKRDTARAISLLEDYCSKLKKPEEQQLKTAILRVMGIFKSSLFQALIGRGFPDTRRLDDVCLVRVPRLEQYNCSATVCRVQERSSKFSLALCHRQQDPIRITSFIVSVSVREYVVLT